MKAILVIDMPKSCDDCELCRDGYLCLRLGEVDESVENGTKDLRCPLKPLEENYISIDWIKHNIPYQSEEGMNVLSSMLNVWRKQNESDIGG